MTARSIDRYMGLGNIQDAANCECVMGACDGDNNFDMGKYNVLQSQCLSPEHQANIESTVLAAMAASRAVQGDNNALREANDRIEICMKLAAFAKCRDEKSGPSEAELEFMKKNSECVADGMAAWNGVQCVAKPSTNPGCPGQAYMNNDMKCVSCPNGVKKTALFGKSGPGGSLVEWFECSSVPVAAKATTSQTQTNNAPTAPEEGMSLTTKLLIGGAVVAGLAVAAKYAMAPKSNPVMYPATYLPATDYRGPAARVWNVYTQRWAVLDERDLGAVYTDAILAALSQEERAAVIAHLGAS